MFFHMNASLAQLNAEQLNKINLLADEMGVILVAYHTNGLENSHAEEANHTESNQVES